MNCELVQSARREDGSLYRLPGKIFVSRHLKGVLCRWAAIEQVGVNAQSLSRRISLKGAAKGEGLGISKMVIKFTDHKQVAKRRGECSLELRINSARIHCL